MVFRRVQCQRVKQDKVAFQPKAPGTVLKELNGSFGQICLCFNRSIIPGYTGYSDQATEVWICNKNKCTKHQ